MLLVFRQPERAWPGWAELMERPYEAARNPEWNITRVERFQTRDGFLVVWLELGPLAPKLAFRAENPAARPVRLPAPSAGATPVDTRVQPPCRRKLA